MPSAKPRHGRMLMANGGVDEIVGTIPVRAALVALLDEGVNAIWALVEKVPAASDWLGAMDVVERQRDCGGRAWQHRGHRH